MAGTKTTRVVSGSLFITLSIDGRLPNEVEATEIAHRSL